MDEMKITSKFMRNVVSKALKVALKAKLGCKGDIQLNEFNAAVNDGKAHVHLNIDAIMTQDELGRILGSIGIG